MVTPKNTDISATRWSAVSFFMILFAFFSMAGVQAQQLTYGSTIRLKHKNTGRFLAATNTPYNSGSRQNVAAAAYPASFPAEGQKQMFLWRVEAADGQTTVNGNPVQIDSIITLKSVPYGSKLHAHGGLGANLDAGLISPSSRQGEVTCFGPSGDGNDNWRVKVNPINGGLFKLEHVPTQRYLHSHLNHYAWAGNDLYQEVTTFWERDNNDDWILEVVASTGGVATQISASTSTQAAVVSVDLFAGKSWAQIEGQLVQITSNNKFGVWGINAQTNVFFRDGVSDSNLVGTGWTQTDGSVLQISTNDINQVWCIGSDKGIWFRQGVTDANPKGTGWQRMDGSGQFHHVWTNNKGHVWALGNLAAAPAQDMEIINTYGKDWALDRIYFRQGVSASSPMGTSWKEVGGLLSWLEVTNSNILWGVNRGGGIFMRTGITDANPMGTDWKGIDGNASQISVNDNGSLVCVNKDGNIYQRLGTSVANPVGSGWAQVSGALKNISLNNRNRVYGVNAAQNIYCLVDAALSKPVAPIAAPVTPPVDRTEIDAARKKVAEVEAALKIAQDEKARLEKEKIALESAVTQAQATLKLAQEDKARLEKEKIASESAATQAQAALKLALEDKARLEVEKAAIHNIAIQAETETIQAQQAASVAVVKAPVTSSVTTTPTVTVPAVASAVTSVVSQVKPVAHVAQSETVQKQAVVSVAPTTVVPRAKKVVTKKVPARKKGATVAKKPAGKKAAKAAKKANKGATKKKQSAQSVSEPVTPVETNVTSDVTQDVKVASSQDSTDTTKVQPVTVQQKKAQKPKKASKKQAKKKKNKAKKGVGTTTLQENQSLNNDVSLEESEPIDELQPTDETAVTTGTVSPLSKPVVESPVVK